MMANTNTSMPSATSTALQDDTPLSSLPGMGIAPQSYNSSVAQNQRDSTLRELAAEHDTNNKDDKDEKKSNDEKRYLPEHKKPDAAPTFPEKLMKMMRYAEEQGDDFCVAWMEDGKSFIIRTPDEFTRNVVPKFFKPTKFSSFTRKLYRWGFRQVNRGIGPDDPIIFGNEHFQRHKAELMAKMRSITAASARKADQRNAFMYSGMKHPLDMSMSFDEHTHKRLMVDQIYQHKATMMQNSVYGGNGAQGMSLTNALRPNMFQSNSNSGMGMFSANSNSAGMGMNNMNGMMSSMQQQQQQPQQNYQSPFSSNSAVQGPNNMNSFDMMAPLPINQPFGAACQQPQSHQGPMGGMNCGIPGVMNQGNPGSVPSSSRQQQMQYPSAQSTAEIVNAAIAALRYAN